MSYEFSWLAVELAPVVLAAVVYAVYGALWLYHHIASAHNRRKMKKELTLLRGRIASVLLYGFYFIYLYVAENTLDVLNCGKIENRDGAHTEEEYLISDPSEVCWTAGETQARLYPIAIAFVFVYILGYPLLLVAMMRRRETRSLIFDDQLLRYQGKGGHEDGLSPYLDRVAATRGALGLLYYRFKPTMPYWIVVVVLRKMCLAVTTIMFHTSASFQLAVLLLVLFVSLVLQMRNLPYSSPAMGAAILRENAKKVLMLDDEEKASPKFKDAAAKGARKKRTKFGDFAHSKTTASVADRLVFEYNTIEGALLSCSVLVCLFGVMLDSDYLANGKHQPTRDALTVMVMLVIAASFVYFGLVIYHEILCELAPGLKCYEPPRGSEKERASSAVDVANRVKNKIFIIRLTWSMVNESEKEKRSVPDFSRSWKQRGERAERTVPRSLRGAPRRYRGTYRARESFLSQVHDHRGSRVRLWYVTSGVCAKLLVYKPRFFDDVTHLCIDEVHERDVDTDVALALARERLRRARLAPRVVLLSATLDAALLRRYFDAGDVIDVPGRRWDLMRYDAERIGGEGCVLKGAWMPPRIARCRDEIVRLTRKIDAEASVPRTLNAHQLELATWLVRALAAGTPHFRARACLVFVRARRRRTLERYAFFLKSPPT